MGQIIDESEMMPSIVKIKHLIAKFVMRCLNPDVRPRLQVKFPRVGMTIKVKCAQHMWTPISFIFVSPVFFLLTYTRKFDHVMFDHLQASLASCPL